MSTSPSASTPDCPVAPPSRATTLARTLHCACLILGGVTDLAAHLKVAELALRRWLEGLEEPPEAVFLAAVEVLLLHIENPARAS